MASLQAEPMVQVKQEQTMASLQAEPMVQVKQEQTMASLQAEPMIQVKQEEPSPTDLSSLANIYSSVSETSSSDASSIQPDDSSHQESISGDCPMDSTEMLNTDGTSTGRERARKSRKTLRERTFLNLPGVLIFREFCLEMNVAMDVKKMNVSQMVANLQKFFFFVRVKPGVVLQQLFEQITMVIEVMRGINIKKDVRFKKVVRVCRGRINSFDHIRCHSPQITEQLSMFCLRKLVLSAGIRPNHPTGLFNLTLLYMVIYMCKGTTHWTELKALLVSMRKSSFVCKRDKSKGLKFITIRNESRSTAGRIYEIPGHPICPFKIVRLFMSKLSIASNYLWQRPKCHIKISECWFHPDASSTINNDWLLGLTENASMTVIYTNMSLVLTPRSIMDSTLADPEFTKTYSNQVQDIPEPPRFDPSDLESALPGGNDKLEIKLLNSSEAQVEIRLTDILWKELFPEWDRTRLQSGYQNHVDFMKHLLEVHKMCKDEICNQEKETEELTTEGLVFEQHASYESPTGTVTIPINVAQHGLQNSPLLTVVNNNNTVPQNVQGAQNFIVPLHSLLESLASTSQTVQPDRGNSLATTSSAGSPRLVASIADASSLLQLNTTAGEMTELSIGQCVSGLHHIGGSSNTVLLPSLVTNPGTNTILPLSTLASTSNKPYVHASTVELLGGNNNILQSLSAPKMSLGSQGVSVQGLTLPISLQNGIPCTGAGQTATLQNTLYGNNLPGFSSNLPTSIPGSQTLLTNAIPNLAISSLQNVVTTAVQDSSNLPNIVSSFESMPALKRIIPIMEPQVIPTSTIQVVPGLQGDSILQSSAMPNTTPGSLPTHTVHQVIAQSAENINTLLTNRINTFAEQLTSNNSARPTYVITNQGIIAVPDVQQSPQTVDPDMNNQYTSTIGIPQLENIPESDAITNTNNNQFSLGVANYQDNFNTEEQGSYSHEYSHEIPMEALDYSTKSHTSEVYCEMEDVDEAPLDLSVSKAKNEVAVQQALPEPPEPIQETCSPSLTLPNHLPVVKERKVQTTCSPSLTLPNPLPVVKERKVPMIKPKIEEPHSNTTWPGIATLASVRRPPPPYPGAAQQFLTNQAIAALRYRRYVQEPSKYSPGFMKMTLKRKGTTGKSVRELLDKKRRNDLARAGHSGESTIIRTSPAVSSKRIAIGLNSVTHKSVDKVMKKLQAKKLEHVLPDNVSKGNGSDGSDVPVVAGRHSLMTLANFHMQEVTDIKSENGQSDLNHANGVNKFSENVISKSSFPVKGGRSGRKSRRKPQKVFKRTIVEDLDIIDEIEGFS